MELLGPEMKLVQGGTSGHGKVFADIILTVPFNISSYVIAKHKFKKIARQQIQLGHPVHGYNNVATCKQVEAEVVTKSRIKLNLVY